MHTTIPFASAKPTAQPYLHAPLSYSHSFQLGSELSVSAGSPPASGGYPAFPAEQQRPRLRAARMACDLAFSFGSHEHWTASTSAIPDRRTAERRRLGPRRLIYAFRGRSKHITGTSQLFRTPRIHLTAVMASGAASLQW